MTGINVDAESRPFWDGIAEGELRLQRCRDCARAVFYPRVFCPHCFGGRLDWFTATGAGTVYSYTVAHRAPGEFAGQVPFVVALVDLDEGVRMLTRILGAGPGDVRIDARVRLDVARLGDAEDSPELPCFRVVEAA
ncbi:Zn-ribbon domain-containing OB-fold protein [Qaidamihabitans albus]|uniref:Zn-ribbon domain-containing OB-fold protein n=1 Tax=Qaidamihabitans albus TaxID=2795733 RepID=UPI0018F1C679|nr:Zn-ribbon domain-containing OB-fold protein [Qaidamihabitans albus]